MAMGRARAREPVGVIMLGARRLTWEPVGKSAKDGVCEKHTTEGSMLFTNSRLRDNERPVGREFNRACSLMCAERRRSCAH